MGPTKLTAAKLKWLLDQPGFRQRPVATAMRMVRWEWYRLNHAALHVSFDGNPAFLVSGNDGIGRLLYCLGGFEEEIFAFLGQYLRAGMTVVDVGANVGTHSAFAAKRVAPSGRVISFEPNIEVIPRLERNLAAFDNTEIRPLALSAAPGTAYLCVADNTAEAALTTGQQERGSEILVSSLDVELQGIDQIDFLKIDVEGHELAVLRGGRTLTWSKVKLMQIEVLADREGIFTMLITHGFIGFTLSPAGTPRRINKAADMAFNTFFADADTWSSLEAVMDDGVVGGLSKHNADQSYDVEVGEGLRQTFVVPNQTTTAGGPGKGALSGLEVDHRAIAC